MHSKGSVRRGVRRGHASARDCRPKGIRCSGPTTGTSRQQSGTGSECARCSKRAPAMGVFSQGGHSLSCASRTSRPDLVGLKPPVPGVSGQPLPLRQLPLNNLLFHGVQSAARLTVSDRHPIAGFDDVGELKSSPECGDLLEGYSLLAHSGFSTCGDLTVQ
jgi:hypothetical protein